MKSTATVTRYSFISQDDADQRALCAANLEAAALCVDDLPGEQPWTPPETPATPLPIAAAYVSFGVGFGHIVLEKVIRTLVEELTYSGLLTDFDYALVVIHGDNNLEEMDYSAELTGFDYLNVVVEYTPDTIEVSYDAALTAFDYFLAIIDGDNNLEEMSYSGALTSFDYELVIVDGDTNTEEFNYTSTLTGFDYATAP